MVDLAEPGLQATQAMITKISSHAKTTIYKADVSDEVSVEAMVDKCLEIYGRLDFACNNAGIGMGNIPTTEIDVKTFDRVHHVNFKGVSSRRNNSAEFRILSLTAGILVPIFRDRRNAQTATSARLRTECSRVDCQHRISVWRGDVGRILRLPQLQTRRGQHDTS